MSDWEALGRYAVDTDNMAAILTLNFGKDLRGTSCFASLLHDTINCETCPVRICVLEKDSNLYIDHSAHFS